MSLTWCTRPHCYVTSMPLACRALLTCSPHGYEQVMSRTGARLSRSRLQRRFCCGCRSGRGAPLPLCRRAWWTASQVHARSTNNPGDCRPGVKLLLDDIQQARMVVQAHQQEGYVQVISHPRWVWCGRHSCRTTHSRARWRARSCRWAPAAPQWPQPSRRRPPACWWMSMSAQPGAITACLLARPTCSGAMQHLDNWFLPGPSVVLLLLLLLLCDHDALRTGMA